MLAVIAKRNHYIESPNAGEHWRFHFNRILKCKIHLTVSTVLLRNNYVIDDLDVCFFSRSRLAQACAFF